MGLRRPAVRRVLAATAVLALLASVAGPLFVGTPRSDARLASDLCRGWAQSQFGTWAEVQSRTERGNGAWTVTGVLVPETDGGPHPRGTRWSCEISGLGGDVVEGRVTLDDGAAA